MTAPIELVSGSNGRHAVLLLSPVYLLEAELHSLLPLQLYGREWQIGASRPGRCSGSS